MISIIHPSRGRPSKSACTIRKWTMNAQNANHQDIEVLVSLEDDDHLPMYYAGYRDSKCKVLHNYEFILSKGSTAVSSINYAASRAKNDILIVVSDDTDCYPGWDLDILKICDGKKDFIIKTQDGTQPWIITMPILDRAYYNRFGYIYHPSYQHMFCDTELTCVADLTGRKLTSNILFKHNHYSVTKEHPDAISKKADGTWDQGEKLFLERYKRNFDLPADQIKGKIQDNGMINWLKRKVR